MIASARHRFHANQMRFSLFKPPPYTCVTVVVFVIFGHVTIVRDSPAAASAIIATGQSKETWGHVRGRLVIATRHQKTGLRHVYSCLAFSPPFFALTTYSPQVGSCVWETCTINSSFFWVVIALEYTAVILLINKLFTFNTWIVYFEKKKTHS